MDKNTKTKTEDFSFLEVYMMIKSLSSQDIANLIKLMQKQYPTHH